MSPVSVLPAIASLLAALAASFLLVKWFGTPPSQGRYASIDGLRGYLAFFVFLHHSCIWYFYLRTGEWQVPPSNLYTHFGESSVALFFMITGFLFFSKLIDGRRNGIDWEKLYISRFLRLAPLYVFAMCLLFLVVAVLSRGTLNEPVAKVMGEVFRWLSFTIAGGPNLNGVQNTANIVAQVTWSLPYEWFFYLSLPLLSLAVGVVPPYLFLALGLASILGLAALHPPLERFLPFLGGIAAALLLRTGFYPKWASTSASSIIVLGSIAVAIIAFPSAYGIAATVLLSVAFTPVACGNDIFGILIRPVSRTLGEIAYSIYLIHGIFLYIVFNVVMSTAASRDLSPMHHWLVITGASPVLILICFASFRLIEAPAMRSTTTIAAWFRSRVR